MLPYSFAGQLTAAQGEVEDLRRANEDWVRRLVEAVLRREETATWGHTAVALTQASSNRYEALRDAKTATVVLVRPPGLSFEERLRGLPVQIRGVARYGVRHGATAANAATHLRFQDSIDLRRVALGFPSEEEMPEGVDVE